jgi:tRNA threonylcarbamoyladenosine biosynthesis protein TsaB
MALALCIETSQDMCSVALGNENGLIDYITAEEIRSHGKNLTLIIDEIFERNQISISKLEFIALSIGPGSYTGLRVGTSVAKGIAFANDLPIVALNSLDIMVHEAYSYKLLRFEFFYPMIDARRMEVYTASFDGSLNCLQSSHALVLTEIDITDHFNFERGLFFGTGAKKLESLTPSSLTVDFNHHISATARAMLKPALHKFNKQEFVDTAYFEPFYLKPFYTNAKKSQ